MLSCGLYICLECILGFQILKLVWRYWIRRPNSHLIAGLPTIIGKWVSSVQFVLQGTEIILKSYKKAAGKPFAIPALKNYYVCISDVEQMKELGNAPSYQLSLRHYLEELVSPRHTRIASFEGSYDSISTIALMIGLRSNLPALRKGLQERIVVAVEREIRGLPDCNGWTRISASKASYQIAGKLNCYVILGEKLASDPALSQAALQFAHDAAITSELMHFTPSILQSPVSFVSMHLSGACKKLQERIPLEVRERLSCQSSGGDADREPLDCIQWIINAFRRSNEMSVAGTMERTMGLLFASAHQVPPLVASSLYTLCKHPEYLPALQEEVSRVDENKEWGTRNQDIPLLDSFVKETVRLHPLQTVAMSRRVMTPFVFSDGTRVPVGNVVCVPQHAVMQDSQHYPDPLEFQGFRYVTRRDGIDRSKSRLSHPSLTFPFWGPASHACPARFYVSMVVKLILMHFIKHYEVKLADPNAKPQFSWGINMITHPSLAFLIRERSKESP